MRPVGPVQLSIVVPVFGCASILAELKRRISLALDQHAITHEIIFVDDASRDDAWGVLADLSAGDRRAVPVHLPVNRGQHAAIAEGLARATGAWAAVMDCDLQDPPELLPEMLTMAARRKAIVVGRRCKHAQVWWRRAASHVLSRAARRRRLSRLVGTHSVFSVLPNEAVKKYLARGEHTDVYLPLLESLGLPIVSFDYDRSPRPEGRSSYSVMALVRRAARLLSGSLTPNP